MPKSYRFLESAPRPGAFFVAIACLFFAASAAFAGVELKSTTTSHESEPPQVHQTTTLAFDGSLRIDVASGPTTIFRGAFKDFLIVDHDAESFTLLDDGAIEDLKASLQYTMLQLDRKMAELPVEQRKRMRDALKPPAPVETRVVKTDQSAKKSGLDCRLFEVHENDELVRQVWVADWDQVEGGDQLQAALEGFEAFTSSLSQAFEEIRSGALGGAQVFDLGANPFDDFKRLGGLPVHTIELEGGKPTFETLIETAAAKKLSQRDFIPPASYRQRPWTGE